MNFNPFDMLVGRVGQVPGLMVPGTPPMPPAVSRPPWGYPGAPYDCGGGWGCPPLDRCPPQSMGFYGQAERSAIAAQSPQIMLGLSTRDQTPNTAVAAGTARTLFATPSVPICITKLTWSRLNAVFFAIVELKSARTSYLADGQAIPADSFTPDASNLPPMQFPSLFPGTQLTITIRNNSADPQHADMAFIGIPAPGCGPCL